MPFCGLFSLARFRPRRLERGSSVRFRRLHDGFGAEVLGFDVPAPTPPDDIEQLKRALDEYQFLLFRYGKQIPPDRQVEITSWFGPPADNSGEGRLWSVLHNEDDAGRRKLPFHSDFTYTDSPIKIISLHAVELPPGGSSTSFVSGIHAWATLPADRQQSLASLTLRHRHVPTMSGPLSADGQPTHPLQPPREFVAEHPVRLIHPRTGQPVLFVTEYHADRVRQLNSDESDRLIHEIFAHLYGPGQVYVHQWQLYDLVIWDNIALQHARRDEADTALGARALQRVALNEVTYPELIARAWEQQRRELQGI
jgi:taurine dioxygenase